MKLGIFGDLHFTNKKPVRRLDEDYFLTQLDKFNQGLDIFDREKCGYVFQVGDFFDAPTVSNFVISEIIALLKKRDAHIYCCYGQHDISGHSASTLKRSPLKILEASGVVTILDKNPIELKNPWAPPGTDKRYFTIYGSSFGTEVPKVHPEDPFNILVTHRMVGDRQLYPEQVLPSPEKFLKDYPDYKLVFVGDYHYRFTGRVDGRLIINPGCLVRKSIGEFDLAHRPAVITYDVNKEVLRTHELKFQPPERIFDLTVAEKKDNTSLLKFIESLQNDSRVGVNWKTVLLEVLKERKSCKEVKNILDDVMETNHVGSA